jgi:S1-C subfamily serine protease
VPYLFVLRNRKKDSAQLKELDMISFVRSLTSALIIFQGVLSAQTQIQVPTSVNSGLLMDAAGPAQRKSLGAIYLIVCPATGAGTGFLLKSGVLVTNSHVVGTAVQRTW